ncbi:hypothetical protein CsSME_00018324 [Camellia sinensis var. sinensis]
MPARATATATANTSPAPAVSIAQPLPPPPQPQPNPSTTLRTNSHMWLEPILAGLVGYVLADLGSGVYHWAIDNYGGSTTPVFGSQIEAFQGHHKWPWTITRRQFANNIQALARAVTFTVLPIDLAFNGPVLHGNSMLGPTARRAASRHQCWPCRMPECLCPGHNTQHTTGSLITTTTA